MGCFSYIFVFVILIFQKGTTPHLHCQSYFDVPKSQLGCLAKGSFCAFAKRKSELYLDYLGSTILSWQKHESPYAHHIVQLVNIMNNNHHCCCLCHHYHPHHACPSVASSPGCPVVRRHMSEELQNQAALQRKSRPRQSFRIKVATASPQFLGPYPHLFC